MLLGSPQGRKPPPYEAKLVPYLSYEAGVTCARPAVKALRAEGFGPEEVVKVERPQRSEDERP